MAADETINDVIVDYITGKPVPNVGVEELRQRLEQYLVEQKGYLKTDIRVDADIEVDINGTQYASRLDLVVSVGQRSFMVVKCAAGSLESREREVISASRIYESVPVPYAVVSDSRTAVIYDTVSGKKIGETLSKIPSRAEAENLINTLPSEQIPEKRRIKEKIIFRSYDSMNVNVSRNR